MLIKHTQHIELKMGEIVINQWNNINSHCYAHIMEINPDHYSYSPPPPPPPPPPLCTMPYD